MQDLRDAADIAKSRVSALEEGKRMGLNPDRDGFCVCPFHREKTASMKLYKGERGFHCFGCGATGDMIRLVMDYYGLSFKQALIRLDSEWGLGLRLTGRPLSRTEQKHAELERWHRGLMRDSEERMKCAALETYYSACRLADEFLRLIRYNAPTMPNLGWNAVFCEGLRMYAEAREEADNLAVMIWGDDR